MAMGRLGARQTNARLSAEELYEIVKILYYGVDRTNSDHGVEYALAITWMESTLRLSVENDSKDTFIEEIRTLLFEIQDEHDESFQEQWEGQDEELINPNEEFFVQKFNGNRNMTSKEMKKLEKEHFNNFANHSFLSSRDFFSICRGEEPKWIKQTSVSRSQRCYVRNFSSPFLLLQPAKIEVLNESPFSWIDKIKELSMNKIRRSKIEATQGVKIGLYSPGGVFLPHMDTLKTQENFINSKKDYIGNRIATLMLYLSDVDGGGTAFTKINKLVYPKKGSSVFWFNLYSDGKEDTLTIHGACPTMYGIKWVSNKWIRSFAQIFKRPCHTTKPQRLHLL